MQSVLLEKGLRVTEDDPIFAVVVLVEMAVNDASDKQLEQLNAALLILEKFMLEMRAISDAVLSASEILTIGRQFLSGENEQILEDVTEIKKSIETIAQRVSISSISDGDRLNNAIETMSASLSHAAKYINGGKYNLHLQNEAFLMDRITEITELVQQIKSMEALLQSVARQRVDTILAPVAQQMSDQVKRLSDKDTYAMRFMQKTNETQEKMTARLGVIFGGAGLLSTLSFIVGFLLSRGMTG